MEATFKQATHFFLNDSIRSYTRKTGITNIKKDYKRQGIKNIHFVCARLSVFYTTIYGVLLI